MDWKVFCATDGSPARGIVLGVTEIADDEASQVRHHGDRLQKRRHH